MKLWKCANRKFCAVADPNTGNYDALVIEHNSPKGTVSVYASTIVKCMAAEEAGETPKRDTDDKILEVPTEDFERFVKDTTEYFSGV